MANITNTSQLSTFTLIRDVLLNNSTISSKFKQSDFYEFEPRLKDIGGRLPHIVIKYAENGPVELVSMNNVMTSKEFSINILLKMSWDARSKAIDYVNAMIRQIEISESTFEASGFYDATLRLVTLDDELEEMKRLIVGQLVLEWNGSVIRE